MEGDHSQVHDKNHWALFFQEQGSGAEEMEGRQVFLRYIYTVKFCNTPLTV